MTAPRIALVCAVFGGIPALAQPSAPPAPAEAPANGVIRYPAAFFADFRPSNAFDMVARVPGFTYAAGDSVRGFAGSGGNVLIDGERPSSKSVTLDDTLKRINLATVERLELIRGGAPGIDMQDQPVVVNVVRRTAADSTLSVDGYSRLYDGLAPSATLRIEGSRRTANTTIEGTLFSQDQAGQSENGDGIVTRQNGAGALVYGGPITSRSRLYDYQATGAAEYRRPADTFRVNGGFKYNGSVRGETLDLTDGAGVAYTDKANNQMSTTTAEFGGDYQRRLSSGLTGRLVGLYTYQVYTQTSDNHGARTARQISKKDTTGAEAIVRGSLTLQRPGGFTLEAGGETAFNYQENANGLVVGGVVQVLPSANVRVEERRSEGFVTSGLKLTQRMSIEAGMRVETSTIGQTGDVTRDNSFTFYKPRVVATFAPRPSTQIRLRVERLVGQLNFDDFAASSDLTSGTVNAGNANLEPDRTWLSEVTFEQRFWGRGALVVTATHRDIEQVVDLIPIFGPTGVFSAPGNLGNGWRNDLKVSLTFPTEKLGVAGGQLRANVTLRKSEVTDPVTGQKRAISLVRTMESDLTYTQDLPSWNSTITLESGNFGLKDRSYRIGEIQTIVDMPVSKATWLYKPRPDLIMAVAIEDLDFKEKQRHRVTFSGTRASGIISGTDYRSTQLSPWLSLRLRKTF